MVVVCTTIEVAVSPPMVVVVIDVLREDLLPSHSKSHTSFPRVGRKRDSLYIHALPSDKKCCTSSLAS